MPINAVSLGVDTMSVSAHKVHALKGCGALYVKDGVSISPLIFGGEQEKRIRPGTENAVGIAAFGAACKTAKREMSVKFALAKECQKRIFEYENNLDFVTVNAKNELPFVTSVCVKGIRSETLLHFLESEGVLVSSGSACSHGKKSHVLVALGLESDVIDSTIRVSVAGNDVSDIDALFEAIIKAHNRLIKR
jgi:cysteine desulfurase